MNKIWFLIPARSGSKAIPKKNLRLLGGKPLIAYVLDSVNLVADPKDIIVSTDDDEIKEFAAGCALVHNRSESTASDEATIDDVALEVAEFLKKDHSAGDDDLLVTIQPTSPFISPSTIREAIKVQKESDCDSLLTVTDDRHLRWTISNKKAEPLYDKRVNRQQMNPVFAETGGVISTTIGFLLMNGTRIGGRISLFEIDEREGLDIDTYADWALAEYWIKKLRIVIRVDGGKMSGFGHLYRALAIAQNIHSHDITFVTRSDNGYEKGKMFLAKHHYPLIEVESNEHFLNMLDDLKPDIVINDILDTEREYIDKLKSFGAFVVNFEDMGKGNRIADLVINDLYPDIFPQKNHWYGVEHAILNPNFETILPCSEPSGNVQSILLAFGGTDPSDLTVKALNALLHIGYKGDAIIVVGPGHTNKEEVIRLSGLLTGKTTVLQDVKNMAAVMKKADLALTSAGRTVTELMTVGVPTIAMCQNIREMRHDHASSSYGVVNLGLGKSITPEVLGDHIDIYLSDIELRIDMYNRMRRAVKNRSNDAIVSKIIAAYEQNKNQKGLNEYFRSA